MDKKPKKIEASLNLTPQELKYLLRGVAEAGKLYLAGSRDYYTEDLHDKVKDKLEKALRGLE